MSSSLLTAEQIAAALQELSGWTLADNTIERAYTFPDFSAAMVFVNRVAELAEEADHHPDITINYNKVKLSLSSHDVGGLTRRDTRLAKSIQRLDQI